MSTQTVVITGASSGLGKCIAEAMKWQNGQEHGAYEDHAAATRPPDLKIIDWSLETGVDVTDETALMFHASKLVADGIAKVDALVNCAGFNSLAPFGAVSTYTWAQHIDVNARAHWLTTRTLLPIMDCGSVCNIISNASHMPMTHSLAYNASKAAAEMVTRQMAHELWPEHRLTVFGISPNKLSGTNMTKHVDRQVCGLRGWSAEVAANYQRSKLAIGEETDPETLAEFIAFLLSTKERHKYLHGCIIEYGK